MGGQVLGGGVIVAVAVALWLIYLLPSWYSRYQYEAAERNALRMNRALRVLAETSEAPEEMRLELNARTALAQQRLARQALAEREQASLQTARAELVVAKERSRAEVEAAKERARVEAEVARAEAEAAKERARADAEYARAEAVVARERARAHAAAAQERARAEAAAARALPAARRARARRRARLVTSVLALAGIVMAGWGGLVLAVTGTTTLLAIGATTTVACALLLVRMARVGARAGMRAGVRTVVASESSLAAVATSLQDVSLADERAWMPRELPRPLTASAGSRAAAALDAAAAQDALRQAALEEAMRERAERAAPPSITAARAARTTQAPFAGRAADDAEIEAHVRDLLTRRASGQ
ncbi:large exoprotein [Microbacterium sp. zg.Y1084]|uniref:large exoprotein n=1 Tax=Microbacterium sp. zg.Y1084 TaxID=2969667 RepID=UPI00214B933F|nr:large exoprotein [Microbacterium sp. zg.Y1084]MCR2812961.1 large exoprotein [Microbacterium sp. zg.Y1084]